MKFNKKCKVLHLERSNLRHQYVLGVTQLESSFSENALRVLADTLDQRPARYCKEDECNPGQH